MKRAFDVTAAVVGLTLTWPILVVAVIAIKAESRGPALYRGLRVGRYGKTFTIHKLRTMRVTPEGSGPAVTAADDPRITRVGRVLRRTKIDELPQLANVLKGEMSLVGPRPEHPDYVRLYTSEQRKLLEVRPGITGPAALAFIDEERQLSGGRAESKYISDVMPKKLALDLRYVATATFGGDIRILARTFLRIVRPGVATTS
jgi:lipopolysaccharide/colanic/teichoic acid biosynthesis glycosyltransferase